MRGGAVVHDQVVALDLDDARQPRAVRPRLRERGLHGVVGKSDVAQRAKIEGVLHWKVPGAPHRPGDAAVSPAVNGARA